MYGFGSCQIFSWIFHGLSIISTHFPLLSELWTLNFCCFLGQRILAKIFLASFCYLVIHLYRYHCANIPNGLHNTTVSVVQTLYTVQICATCINNNGTLVDGIPLSVLSSDKLSTSNYNKNKINLSGFLSLKKGPTYYYQKCTTTMCNLQVSRTHRSFAGWFSFLVCKLCIHSGWIAN